MSEHPLHIELLPDIQTSDADLDRIIYDLNTRIDLSIPQADVLDYAVAACSGLLCGLLDILWTGEFNLIEGRGIAKEQVECFVRKSAHMLGCEKDDLYSAVRFLEKMFPIPSDSSTAQFGGGLQHHLRDFAHHPTLVGLIFSILTQFTSHSYGTDKSGAFVPVKLSEKGLELIGKDIPQKILFGTITWFFHLVSDMAGSNSSVMKSGGTGIPGILLSLAKELSALPLFRNIAVGEFSLSEFLSKLFNGTLLAQHDESGHLIKDTLLRFDLRTELGIGIELGKQALPVLANECIVRTFYFLRRLTTAMKQTDIHSFSDMKYLNWTEIKPTSSPTLSRMLTIATGVFTTVDLGEAALHQTFWLSVNYVGIGRFAIALSEDISWGLKTRNLVKIKEVYQTVRRFSYRSEDEQLYERIASDMSQEKLGLTLEQAEILYNLEYHKTLNDIQASRIIGTPEAIKALKREWLREWQQYITNHFAQFLQIEQAEMHWYSLEELVERVESLEPNGTWLRLVLLETMLFEPYFPLGVETDKKGTSIPSKKYNELHKPLIGYDKKSGDIWLDSVFTGDHYTKGYIQRLRKCYNEVLGDLNEVLKTALTTLAIAAAATIVTITTLGMFSPSIAVALVGSKFVGLHGIALTNACLAFFGGGAIAAGGLGVAGGTAVIVGGGAILALGLGTTAGGAALAIGMRGKKDTILQSAKLLVSIREIFLNDEHDLAYSNSVFEQYTQNILTIQNGLNELRMQSTIADKETKKKLDAQIREAEKSVEAMNRARKHLHRFITSFETGTSAQ